eukprot:scaffold6161_cov72-Phaeocystis_antarctica.AAC.3
MPEIATKTAPPPPCGEFAKQPTKRTPFSDTVATRTWRPPPLFVARQLAMVRPDARKIASGPGAHGGPAAAISGSRAVYCTAIDVDDGAATDRVQPTALVRRRTLEQARKLRPSPRIVGAAPTKGCGRNGDCTSCRGGAPIEEARTEQLGDAARAREERAALAARRAARDGRRAENQLPTPFDQKCASVGDRRGVVHRACGEGSDRARVGHAAEAARIRRAA